MDRCRCDDYKKAMDELHFFIPGTYYYTTYNNIEKLREGLVIQWKLHRITPEKVCESAKVYKIYEPHEIPGALVSEECKAVERMWCPYMLNPPKIRR